MAKQTLVFESAVELSLNGEMILISDKATGVKTLRSIEDIRLVLIDNRMVRISSDVRMSASILIGKVFNYSGLAHD